MMMAELGQRKKCLLELRLAAAAGGLTAAPTPARAVPLLLAQPPLHLRERLARRAELALDAPRPHVHVADVAQGPAEALVQRDPPRGFLGELRGLAAERLRLRLELLLVRVRDERALDRMGSERRTYTSTVLALLIAIIDQRAAHIGARSHRNMSIS